MLKMISATVETICFQDQIPVIVSTSLELETYIKGRHVFREIWTASSCFQGNMDSRGESKAQPTDGTRQSCC